MVHESKDASRGSAGAHITFSKTVGVALLAAGLLLAGASHQQRVDRAARIDQMTEQEKAELARKYDRFLKLSPEKQDELRRLHDRIEAESDRDELREVMRRYCDWLDTLPYSAGYELRQRPVDERMDEIAKRRHGPQDVRALRAWWTDYWRARHAAERKAAEAIARDPGADRRDPPRQPMGPAGHLRAADPRRVFRQMGDPSRAIASLVKQWELAKADFAPLRAQLSKATGEQFDKKSRKEQEAWVVEQFIEISRQEMRRRMRGSPPVQPTDEQLSEFYHSDAVSEEEREWLMRMPGQEMHANLTRWYQMDNSLMRPGPREGRKQSGSREPLFWLSSPRDGRRDTGSRPSGARPAGPREPFDRDHRPRDGRRRTNGDAQSR